MIAVVPPLWAILFLCMVIGAAALYVVVVGLLWVWGRREEPRSARSKFEEEFGASIFIPFEDPVAAVYRIGRGHLERHAVIHPRGSGVYDWAHRHGYLNPEGRMITARGEQLGATEWPRA